MCQESQKTHGKNLCKASVSSSLKSFSIKQNTKNIGGVDFIVIASSSTTNGNEIIWIDSKYVIQQLAIKSTRVAIIDDAGNQVVSIANTSPIQRIRAGKSASLDGATNLAAIQAAWTASDNAQLNKLTQTCSTSQGADLFKVIYHACGNLSGLHWITSDSARWDLSGSDTNLHLALDYNET